MIGSYRSKGKKERSPHRVNSRKGKKWKQGFHAEDTFLRHRGKTPQIGRRWRGAGRNYYL